MGKPDVKKLDEKIAQFTRELNASLSPEQLEQWVAFLNEKRMRQGFDRALEKRNLKQAIKHWDDTQYVFIDQPPSMIDSHDIKKFTGDY